MHKNHGYATWRGKWHFQGVHDGALQIAFIEVVDEMRNHLRVRLGYKVDALILQPRLQLGEVLNDSIVDHRQVTRRVGLRMCVDVRRFPMRRPAGMPDAARAREIEVPGRMGEGVDLAFAMEHLQLAVLLDGHELRVVADVERPVNRPVVRNRHALPGRIVEIRTNGLRMIFAGKSPALFQFEFRPGGECGKSGQ